jgi:hypothetical protein
MSEQHKVRKWISDLLFNAIIGALGALLVNLLGTWLLPEYWWPRYPGWWAMAGIGAVGGMLAYCFGLRKRRQSEKPN